MKNICYVSALALLISFCGNAQLNEYKYVIVPTKLEGFNKENQHNTSTLLKHLFAKANYNVMYENALTEDLKTNGCLGLKANLEDNSSLFVTKVNIVVENCNGQKVFTSKEGKSKKKEFKAAYSEAIRKAFSSFEELNYAYSPKKESSNDEPIADSFKNDGKAMETNGNTQSNPKNQS